MKKIRKGDEVIVIAGKDKGKRGVVSRRVNESHVEVEGVNVVKKHAKPNPMKGVVGGIIDKVMPIHQSNVSLVDASGKASRSSVKEESGKHVRVLKSSGAAVGV